MNKSQQVVKAYSTDNTVEAKLTEGINQANKLTLSVPLKDRLDSNIFYALIPTDDSTNYLMFKLNDESIENDRITYTGIDAAYDELRGYAYIKEIRPVNRTAKEILQLILEDTRWEVGYIDSSTPTNTFFYYQSVLECIQQVVQLFNVELTFTYSFNTKTQEITARNVNVYKQQGRRTGKRFEYGSNLLTVTREEDSQDIVTALVGRGKGEEKLDDDTGEATGGYGRRINFKDVVWSKANGDPTDKPAGQEYVENKEATKIFGYDDGTPRTGIVVFEDIEDPAELLKATWDSLLSSCRPKVCFKASVTDVGDLRLGDTIAIIRHDLGIEYFTRVFKVVRDLKNEQNNTVEMGDDLSQNTLTSYVTDISNTANKAVQQANDAVVSAGSKNKTFYSATKPRTASEGDNLYLSLGNGEFEYWVWHNNQWQFIQSTQDLDVVKQNVKQAQDDIKKTNEDLEKSKEDFNKSFVDLGKSVVDFKGSLNDLDKDLEGAKGSIADLDKSVGDFKGSMAELDKQVKDNQKINSDNYTVVVGKIKDLSDNSVDKNSFSELTQTVIGINTQVNSNNEEISSLTQTVKGINTEVSNNKGEISELTQTVKGISTNVSNNQGEISELKQSVKGISTSVSNNSGYISTIKQTIKGINSSVSDTQSNISSLTQTVKGVSTSVENNSSDISTLKQTAEGLQTQVSDNSNKLVTINQTVDGVKVTAEDGIKKYTELSQTVDGLRSKVDQGVNHSEIQQLKDQIDLKVSKGDVVSELNLEAGRALISSNKIVLDADSVIFNGKAFIPDAAISGISADKINTGTLDAGKINVININADNITSGSVIGANMELDLATGKFFSTNDKKESVSLYDGKMYFSAYKYWKDTSETYGCLAMYPFGVDDISGNGIDGMMEIEGTGGLFIHDKWITPHDVMTDYGWDYSGDGNLIMMTAHKKGFPKSNGIDIISNGYITIREGKADAKYGSDEYNDSARIMMQHVYFNGIPKSTIGLQAYQVSVDVGSDGGVSINGRTTVMGDFQVVGNKNAVVPTSKGMAAINAYETAEYYFGDIGKSKTDETRQAVIKLDPLFMETVNTEIPYHVFVSSYSDSYVWVEQMNKDSFVVKSSKPNAEFSWEIKAKRLGYEDNRLKITQKDIPKELIPQYKEKGIM